MARVQTSVGIGFILVGCAVAFGCGSEVEGIPEPEAELPNGSPDAPAPAAPAACAKATGIYVAAREPSNVLFLYDRSGSMHLQLPSKATRWDATKKGFFELLGRLPPSTAAGLMLFPQGDKPVNAWCGINADNDVDCKDTWPEPPETMRCDASKYAPSVPSGLLAPAHLAAIRDQVVASDASFYWGTPLATALTAAITAQKGSALPGAKSVILLTDGNPTSCDKSGISNDIGNVVAAARAGLESAGVRTFVIGLVDGNRQAAKAENLSPIAVAGGTKRSDACEATNECFYKLTDATFAEDLEKVFDEVSTQAFDCTFNLPEATTGADPSMITVQLGDGTSTRGLARDATRANGWDYLPGGKQIQLFGQACMDMKDERAKLEIVLGCKKVAPATQPASPSVRRD